MARFQVAYLLLAESCPVCPAPGPPARRRWGTGVARGPTEPRPNQAPGQGPEAADRAQASPGLANYD